MKSSELKHLRKLERAATQAALAAGHVLMRHFGHKLKLAEKPGAGLVTNADVAAEKCVLRMLKRAHPEMAFLTEESEQTGSDRISGAAGRFIVDPLDGTTNFVHGFPMFCVSIGVEFEGRLVAGVIYHPVLKDLYTASVGHGAKLNGKKMRVSRTSRLTDALLTTGFTYRRHEERGLHREMGAFEKLSGVARAVRRPGSAALDLAYTARGVFDGFWEQSLAAWDVAAGAVLVQEAGGQVSDFEGGPFQVEGRQILASNGVIHDALSQTLAPQFCPLPSSKN